MPSLEDAINGVQYVADSLDKPGRAVRGAFGGNIRELLNLIPFSDAMGLTDPNEAVSGRDLLEKAGIIGENTDGLDAGDVGGFAAEMVLDPTNLIGGGLLTRLLGKASKAKATNATARELLENAPHKFLPEGFHSTHNKLSSPAGIQKTGSYLEEQLPVAHTLAESELPPEGINAAVSKILGDRLGQPNHSSLSEAKYFYTPNGRSIRVAEHPRYYHFEDSGVDLFDDLKKSNYESGYKEVPAQIPDGRRAWMEKNGYSIPTERIRDPDFVEQFASPEAIADAAIAANEKLPRLDLQKAIQRWDTMKNRQDYGSELYNYINDVRPMLTKENQHADLVDLLRSEGLKHPKGFRGKNEYAYDYLADQFKKVHPEPGEAELRSLDDIIGIQDVPRTLPLAALLAGMNVASRNHSTYGDE